MRSTKKEICTHTVIIKIMLLETQGETKAPSDPNTDAPTGALMN